VSGRPAELRDTALWQVPIEEASVKARSGTTIDPESDFGVPVWAGHIPAHQVFGAPVPAAHLPGRHGPGRPRRDAELRLR
jgi:uncharacterized protein